jgi:hypothetical protein
MSLFGAWVLLLDWFRRWCWAHISSILFVSMRMVSSVRAASGGGAYSCGFWWGRGCGGADVGDTGTGVAGGVGGTGFMGGGRICMSLLAVRSVMSIGRMLLIGACSFDAVMLLSLPSGLLSRLLSSGSLSLLLSSGLLSLLSSSGSLFALSSSGSLFALSSCSLLSLLQS